MLQNCSEPGLDLPRTTENLALPAEASPGAGLRFGMLQWVWSANRPRHILAFGAVMDVAGQKPYPAVKMRALLAFAESITFQNDARRSTRVIPAGRV